jgi:hypothetical protein
VILLLANDAPCGQDARFGVVCEPVLVGEPREQDGAAVELFEFAGELQKHRAPVVSVGDHMWLPERQRVRDALRVTGERPFRIAQKKQSSAGGGEGALPGVATAKGEYLRSMAVDLVEGEHALDVVIVPLQIAAEHTR